MTNNEILKELIEKKLVTQQIRVDISPMHSYSQDIIEDICKKYNITEEYFTEEILSATHKKFFAFIELSKEFSEIELLYDCGKLYDMNDPKIKAKLERLEMIDKYIQETKEQ